MVGALALAGALAISSAVSAAVDDPIILEDGGGHLVVMLVDDSADFANVMPQAIERDFVVREFAVLDDPAIEAKPLHAPLDFEFVALVGADTKEVGCADDPSARMPLSAFGAIGKLTACTSTSRHYDPGWRVG